ncbi:MAG: ATP-dependent DNA helicase RecG [Betaproteobacteria bacterium]|nr:ATP-dependent DNA helicase RecG [Betaproteobacteria bacterium]
MTVSPPIKATAAVQGKLDKLGLHTVADLLLHLPLRYQDETRLYPIAHAPQGQAVLVEGEVIDTNVQYRPRRTLVCRVEDGSGEMTLRFLNFYPSQIKQLSAGKRVRLFGEMRYGFLGMEMVHPQYRMVHEGDAVAEALTPIYPTTAGLSQAALRKLVLAALSAGDLADTLPDDVTQALNLPGFAESIAYLHQPPPDAPLELLAERTHPAWQRLKFDELLAQQLSMSLHYRRRRAQSAAAMPSQHKLTKALLESLPFPLTRAQQRAGRELAGDLACPHPMQRLLQGDVGSGKTVVAALAALQAIENGFQAAIMAPTEILAEQHFLKLSGWLAPLGLRVVWLAAGLPKKDKLAALEAIAAGTAHLAVGTHALFQDQVEFHNLGLAIIDEQHRFGVHQRLALRKKGAQPHQLMMSATPIPRTLSMSYYADLDVSVIDELPPGRTPIVTKLVGDSRRDEVVARVREACLKGRQIYWVCPLIEESETLQLKTATETFEALSAIFPELKVGLVHGRLNARDKAAAMEAFKSGATHLLVATTVIEVGVDVPNASLMVIEHAERFGLSQLHQLRGRVGRGTASSACILLYQTPLSETARARLKIIYENSDGFEIARHDLLLRGPGEFLGARQSGVPMLKIADIEQDMNLLETARQVAAKLIAERPDVAERHLQRWLAGAEQFLKV